MARMAVTASSVVVPLVINSAVGLTAVRSPDAAESVSGFRAWNMRPGLFGSLFVFTRVAGVRELGRASTVTALPAGRLRRGPAHA